MSKANTSAVALAKKTYFSSRCGEYGRFLTAADISELLGLSRASSYKLLQTGRFKSAQQELLELKLFGLIPGWHGWKIEPGAIIDPAGYRYSIGDIQSIPLLKSMSRSEA